MRGGVGGRRTKRGMGRRGGWATSGAKEENSCRTKRRMGKVGRRGGGEQLQNEEEDGQSRGPRRRTVAERRGGWAKSGTSTQRENKEWSRFSDGLPMYAQMLGLKEERQARRKAGFLPIEPGPEFLGLIFKSSFSKMDLVATFTGPRRPWWTESSATPIVPALTRTGNETLSIVYAASPSLVRLNAFFAEMRMSLALSKLVKVIALSGDLDFSWTSTTTSSSTLVVGSVMSAADSPSQEMTIRFSSVHER